MGKAVKFIVILCLSVVIACMTAWASLAIFYSNVADENHAEQILRLASLAAQPQHFFL